MDPLTILIADDHPMFRAGLQSLLAAMEGVAVVGEATTGAEAVAMAEALQPDVVLLDLQMPEGGGLGAIRRIVHTSPHIRILVVTMFDDDDSIFAAMRAGARGYVLKDADGADLRRAVRAVGRGEAIFGPAIAARMMRFFDTRPDGDANVFPELTDSERAVLQLLATGARNDAIAAQLRYSPKTVRNYVSNIFGKLQVADRAQAIVKAREAGMGRAL